MIHNNNADSSSLLEGLEQQIGLVVQDPSDQNVRDLHRELVVLEEPWQRDKVLSIFLKIMRAVEKYISIRKRNAHPDALPFLGRIFTLLKEAADSPDMGSVDKKSRLDRAIEEFKVLKQKISSGRQVSGKADLDAGVEKLKVVILSVDWEISDATLQALEQEIGLLKRLCRSSKTYGLLLRMLENLGRYIASKKSQSHPDALSLLHSVFQSFEAMVLNPAMDITTQKNILADEIQAFQKFKKEISVKKSPMDDLLYAKTEKVTPADELLDEIMLGDMYEGDAPGLPSEEEPPEDLREVVPSRLNVQPIPEIESRLDAFFDEDEPLARSSMADEGDMVVPYMEEDGSQDEDDSADTGKVAHLLPEKGEDDLFPGEISGEDTDSGELSPVDMGELPSVDEEELSGRFQEALPDDLSSDTDAMVPFQFEDEYGDDEVVVDGGVSDQSDADAGMDITFEDLVGDGEGESGKELPGEDEAGEAEYLAKIEKCMDGSDIVGEPDMDEMEAALFRLKDLRKDDPEALVPVAICLSLLETSGFKEGNFREESLDLARFVLGIGDETGEGPAMEDRIYNWVNRYISLQDRRFAAMAALKTPEDADNEPVLEPDGIEALGNEAETMVSQDEAMLLSKTDAAGDAGEETVDESDSLESDGGEIVGKPGVWARIMGLLRGRQ